MSQRLRTFTYADDRKVRVTQAEYQRKVRAQAAAAARWGKVRVQRSDGGVDILTPAQAAKRERRREAAREGHRRRRIRERSAELLQARGRDDVDSVALGGGIDLNNPWVIEGGQHQVAEGSDARDLIRDIIDRGRDAYFGRVDGTVSVVLDIDGTVQAPIPIGVVRDGEAEIQDGRWRDGDELARINDWRPRVLALLQNIEDARYNRAAIAAAMMPGAFVSQLEGTDEILPGDIDQGAQGGGREIDVRFDLVFDPL